jgi:hypothetical protein
MREIFQVKCAVTKFEQGNPIYVGVGAPVISIAGG